MAAAAPIVSLEKDAERLAAELATRGLAFLPVPHDAVDQAACIFDHISADALADEGECMNFEPPGTWPPLPHFCRRFVLPYLPVQQLNFFVGDQGDKDTEEEFLRYANASRLATLTELAEPMEKFLEPLTRRFFGDHERVLTVNAQYIFGSAKSVTEAHRDFFSRNTISMLTPLYEYTPEEASLYYWRFDENPEFYRTNDIRQARVRRTYAYRRGEAVVFSGDLYHQTVPFKEPPGGWGSKPCRALLCLVIVAANALQAEERYESIVKNLRGPAGGYIVDPATEEWLTSSPSDSEDGEASEGSSGVSSNEEVRCS